MGVKKVGLVVFHEGQGLVRFTTRTGEWTLLQTHTTHSVADSSQNFWRACTQQGEATRSLYSEGWKPSWQIGWYSMRGRHQSGSWKYGGNVLRPRATQLSHWTSLSLSSPLCLSPGSWLSAGHELCRSWAPQVVWTGNQEVGLMLPPRLMPYGGKCSTQERWCLWWRRETQHRDPGGSFFSHLPELQTQVPSHMILVHFLFPPPEPKVSGSKKDFCLLAL